MTAPCSTLSLSRLKCFHTYDLLAQNELGGLLGPAVAIMQHTRVRALSPDVFGLGTCSIVPRLFLEWVLRSVKVGIRETINSLFFDKSPLHFVAWLKVLYTVTSKVPEQVSPTVYGPNRLCLLYPHS